MDNKEKDLTNDFDRSEEERTNPEIPPQDELMRQAYVNHGKRLAELETKIELVLTEIDHVKDRVHYMKSDISKIRDLIASQFDKNGDSEC